MPSLFSAKNLSLFIICLFFLLKMTISCSEEAGKPASGALVSQDSIVFAGTETCISCHAQEAKDWLNSDHDLAMKPANASYVLGDFDNSTFTHKGETYRFFRRDSQYLVEAPGPEGVTEEYKVSYTFGWDPLQQYLIDFGKGKFQALNIAWDTEHKNWFALNPSEDIAHGDWLHWTGGAMNWNTMCADCHSTNLKQNYFAEKDSFHTTWSEINVGCEACHGPGRDHVAFMHSDEGTQAGPDRIREDLLLTKDFTQDELLSQCASCHSLREKLTDVNPHDGQYLDHYNPNLPHPDNYFADGQIRGEVYVYASFLQSKMYKNGVHCMDCHNPHSLELVLSKEDNSLCMQCHEPRYNSPDHHFHEVATKGAQCVSCHMPGRYYMEIDYRLDHSFRVPRPDLSVRFGSPNACNDCHQDRSAEWAAAAVSRWYGDERPEHHSEIWLQADSLGHEAIPGLTALLHDTAQNAIVRATTAWYLGQFPTEESLGTLAGFIRDPHPLVRNSAVRAISNLSPVERQNIPLEYALEDPVRSVRIGAARGLLHLDPIDISSRLRSELAAARKEYASYLYLNQYFPQGRMNLGQYYESIGEGQKAVEAYEKAIETDGYFNAARMNLAYLYNQAGENNRATVLFEKVISQEPDFGPAYYYLALLRAEQGDLEGALPYFEQAAERMPDNPRVRYNQAISFQQLGNPQKAEEAYLSAIRLSPGNPDFLYGLCTLYIQQEEYEKALPYVKQLTDGNPQNPQFRQMEEMIRNYLN